MNPEECSYCSFPSTSNCPQCKMPYCVSCLEVHLENNNSIDLCPQQLLDIESLRQVHPINIEIGSDNELIDFLGGDK